MAEYRAACGHPASKAGLQRCRKCWCRRGPEHPAAVPHLSLTYDEAKAAWDTFIGRTQRPPSRPTPKPRQSERLLIISDLHVPFHEPAMLAEVLKVDADHLIVAGDLLDCYSLSRFVRYEVLPWQTEWSQAQLVMDTLAGRYPKVSLIGGNHEARLEKQVRTHLPEAMVEAVLTLTGGTLDPLKALVRPHRNVSLLSHRTPEGHEMGWLAQIGDLVMGHAEVWSDVPGAALRRWDERLSHHMETWGITDYRLLLLPHTHSMGWVPWGNRLLVETGCLCRTMEYMRQPRGSKRPQRRGYVTLVQHEGRVDLTSLRLHCFDLA